MVFAVEIQADTTCVWRSSRVFRVRARACTLEEDATPGDAQLSKCIGGGGLLNRRILTCVLVFILEALTERKR